MQSNKQQLLESYIKQLESKIDKLEGNDFTFGARLALRKEIENCYVLLQEFSMDRSWESLSEVFNLPDEKRPSRHQEEFPLDVEGEFGSKFFLTETE